jgi:beta-galactosidase
MKALYPLVLAGLFLLGGLGMRADAPGEAAAEVRTLIDLNPGWRFHAGDQPGAQETGFDDSSWQAVDLPHTWNALDGEDGGNDYRRGAGWYRRHFSAEPALAGRRLYLQFDGAGLMADVYVNGRHLGNHRGGFAGFRFDATDALVPGRDNVIAVRVDNGHLGIPPTSADFTFSGGLYRSVSLLVTDPVQISAMDMGSPGVFVTQRNVSRDSADIEVRTEIENHEDSPRDVAVVSSVADANGAPVMLATATRRVGAHGSAEVVQSATISKPHLWDGRADPYIYSTKVELRVGASIRDAVTQPLGLRFFRADPDRGFFLNGHYLDLHGVNRHQDRIDKGWAISQADEAEDFSLVKELGCTAIRSSHYQQSQTWYGRCDRAGIVVWAEIPFVNQALATPEFLENARQQLRELIRQNYNHPAILFWSVGNETSGAAADGIIASLAALVRQEDPTRLSTYASCHAIEDPRNWRTDVVGFNRYYGWYSGEIAEFARNMDETHALHPKAAFGVSEYGAGASIFQHEENPARPNTKGPWHPEEYQARLHEAYWRILSGRPYIWGKFVWCMFDFASDGRGEGDHLGRNDKGLVTYDRKTRKDAFYFYKANWSDEPVLHIASRRFAVRAQPSTDIRIYSNASKVSLTVNGVSLGARRAPDHVFVWPGVALSAGANHIEASADFGGRPVTDACDWTLRPGG